MSRENPLETREDQVLRNVDNQSALQTQENNPRLPIENQLRVSNSSPLHPFGLGGPVFEPENIFDNFLNGSVEEESSKKESKFWLVRKWDELREKRRKKRAEKRNAEVERRGAINKRYWELVEGDEEFQKASKEKNEVRSREYEANYDAHEAGQKYAHSIRSLPEALLHAVYKIPFFGGIGFVIPSAITFAAPIALFIQKPALFTLSALSIGVAFVAWPVAMAAATSVLMNTLVITSLATGSIGLLLGIRSSFEKAGESYYDRLMKPFRKASREANKKVEQRSGELRKQAKAEVG